MPQNVEILHDRAALVARALDLTLAAYREAVAARGQFAFVAAGGSTPKPLYQALATCELDWSLAHVFWGDERYVPPTDPQSNEGMTRRAWLDLVSIPPANIHPMPTNADDPAIAASRYEAHLRNFFHLAPGEFPSFDLTLLGLGDDGHTASLFPHTPALAVSDRLVTVGQKDNRPRLTLTAPAISASRAVLFLVEGAAKAEAVRAILAEEGTAEQYPARLIRGNVTWLLDAAAAAKLP